MADRDRPSPKRGLTYKDSGVDIDAGNALVDRIKPLARATLRPEVLSGIGGFSGLVGLPARYREPILVSGTDGVGTKLKWAFATGRHDTVGIDLVAMCANDVAVAGAEPLFFLDYFGTGRLQAGVAEAVIAGIAEGCRQAGCALLGGETAELPGLYGDGEYDVAGFCVGVVERSGVKDGAGLAAGDVLLGLASAGLHSNGHSLVRKAVETLGLALADRPDALGGATLADELLRPTRIYVKALLALSGAGVAWKGAAHITGGGLVENPPRFVPKGAGLGLELQLGSWPIPPIFPLLQEAGIDDGEMRRTFNLGLGMIVAVGADDVAPATRALEGAGETVYRVGQVVAAHPGEVEFTS